MISMKDVSQQITQSSVLDSQNKQITEGENKSLQNTQDYTFTESIKMADKNSKNTEKTTMESSKNEGSTDSSRPHKTKNISKKSQKEENQTLNPSVFRNYTSRDLLDETNYFRDSHNILPEDIKAVK